MDDDELLFDIKETAKKSRTSFESVVNKKRMSEEDLDDLMNCF